MPPPKVYAVARGLQVGIFHSWSETEPLVKGFAGAKFKSFPTMEAAKKYLRDGVETSSLKSSNPAVSLPKVIRPVAPLIPTVQRSPAGVPPTGMRQPQIVYTDGACPSNGQRGARGGYGVFFEPNPYQEHPDGSISAVAPAGVQDVRNISRPLHPGDNVTNNVAEMRGIIAALSWAVEERGSQYVCFERETKGHGRLKPNQPLHIYTDSTYCIKGITLYLSNWMNNGFKKADKSPVLNRDLWQLIYDLMVALKGQFEASTAPTIGSKRERSPPSGHQSAAVEFFHVKGHAGVPGNEAADRLAVAGASHHN